MGKLFAKPFVGTEILPVFNVDKDEKEFIDFLQEDALEFQQQNMSKVFLFSSGEKVIGYCAISVDSVMSPLLSEQMVSKARFKIPALKIGRLFIDTSQRGKGYGTEIVGWCISKAFQLSKYTGCRLVIVDAVKSKVKWYQKRGFEIVPEQRTQKKENYKMFYDLAFMQK